MRVLTRLARVCPTPVAVLLLAGVLFLSLTAATRGPHGEPESNDHRIIVNSPLDAVSTEAGVVTLADALARAVHDPADNLIAFDAEALGAEVVSIALRGPICVGTDVGGHDRIDGGALPGGLVLNATACPDAGVMVGGTGRLTLARLTLQAGQQRTVLIKDEGQLALEQVTVRDSRGPGIAVFGQGRLSLMTGRLLENHTHGLELHDESSATLYRVELARNRQSGLAAFDEAAVEATECRASSNAEWNLVLTRGAQVRLTRCAVERARFANADLSGSAVLRLSDCTVSEGQRFGIFATGEARAELADTALRDHGGRGAELQDEARLEARRCRIESSGDYGLILFGQAQAQLTDTVVAHNAAHGASMRGQASAEFTRCAFVGNRYSGIGCLDAHDGGRVRATQCTFTGNGMRPIYRGPLHLDPMVPTPVRIQDPIVSCQADPHATIELYLDRAGEATHYVRTVRADRHGWFHVDLRELPPGWALTASATVDGSTSELNVVAGTSALPVLNALLGQTGPLSDRGGSSDPEAGLRRWAPGTHVIFHLPNPPSVPVERYVRFLVDRIDDWTSGRITTEVQLGRLGRPTDGAVVVPIEYVDADSPQLMGRGGVTFMKWNAAGYFSSPMKIMLATAGDARETCPRVLAHEIGHTLGLGHVRVGLLSRMQGSTTPSQAFVNDFSPMMTYYDVLALQILYDPRNRPGTTLRQLAERGVLPSTPSQELARTGGTPVNPTFSPAARTPTTPARRGTGRP